MPLTKTVTVKNRSVTNCLHKVEKVEVLATQTNIYVNKYDNQAAADGGQQNRLDSFKIYSAIDDPATGGVTHHTDYFLTVHATDNVIKRAETYLKEKEADLNGATIV